MTAIEWTDQTWNPVVGCSAVSPGCTNCYAIRMATRMSENPATPQYHGTVRRSGNRMVWTGKISVVEKKLNEPYKWRTPRMVFVNSMSDLFHDDIPVEVVHRVFDVMRDTPQHTYQVLTKRHVRLMEMANHLPWPHNVWMGVSVENEDFLSRVSALRDVPAAIRFLSLEPLLGSLPSLKLSGIHWVIVGGESGHGARPCKEEWVRLIRDKCVANNVPFFFKQWGGVRPKSGGKVIDGREWCEFPKATHVGLGL